MGNLALVVDWARSMGYSNNHDLIASCLEFFDTETQVSTTNLSQKLYSA